MEVKTNQGVKSMELSAVIIRADGTREELGVIQQWNRNPLINWFNKIKMFIRRFKKNG